MDDSFQAVEAGDEEILEAEAFQIFDGRGFPKVETAGVLCGGDESEFNAGAEAEDAIAGDFENAFALFQDFMFLTAAIQKRDDFLRVQQETQTVCPLKETGFLPGKRRRPRWASTCFLNSSEVIERREDKISFIRSSLMSGRMGISCWRLAFTGHEDRAELGELQDRFSGGGGWCVSKNAGATPTLPYAPATS